MERRTSYAGGAGEEVYVVKEIVEASRVDVERDEEEGEEDGGEKLGWMHIRTCVSVFKYLSFWPVAKDLFLIPTVVRCLFRNQILTDIGLTPSGRGIQVSTSSSSFSSAGGFNFNFVPPLLLLLLFLRLSILFSMYCS